SVMLETTPRTTPVLTSLSARLLILTIFFVMVAEVLIYAPSIARYRKAYLEEHITKAHLATLALTLGPSEKLANELEQRLLEQTGTHGIVLKGDTRRLLMLDRDMPPNVDVMFDLREGNSYSLIRDAFQALLQDENRVMRVIGVPDGNPKVFMEVILDETPMRESMYDFSGRILLLSLVIAFIVAFLVYVSLQWLMVRPMRRITESMMKFRASPEDESSSLIPTMRSDEIGVAQRELVVMQNGLRFALRQKTRLAALGAAMAKMNHDLRNTLATAVLASDRLANIDDPEVKRVTPRLYDAVTRAVSICSQTLTFISDDKPTLTPTLFHFSELVAEVGAAMQSDDFPTLGGEEPPKLKWLSQVDFELDVEADRQQLFRVFSNLALNANQAGATQVRISAETDGVSLWVNFADNGPGLPADARAHLFEPFAGSTKAGGTGLGLVIARDILQAHGGDIIVVRSDTNGTLFRLSLPRRITQEINPYGIC
ncbi:MAG: HAMP domain-containing histidine kinase, partial [Rhodospirillales bacterium]|nr:HAMP domain-containing histidine kinase [Rhodospirillales bacterium]